MKKRKEILAKHKYEIWQGKDGKWRTYLTKDDGKRIQRVRITREDIEDVIVNHIQEKEYNPTVEQMFDEWLCLKYEREDITVATRDRYKRQFSILPFDFRRGRIKAISEMDIEDMIMRTISEHKLTIKAFSNIRTIMYGVFKRAKRKGLIDYNIIEIFSDLDLSKRMFRRSTKKDSELVFSDVEAERIISHIITNPDSDIVDLGILLMFKTGVRPGEISALKKEDIKTNSILVKRTEVEGADKYDNKIRVVRDFPKTLAGIREIFVPDTYTWLLTKIKLTNPFGEYAFEIDGKRVMTSRFSSRFKTICNRLGIPTRSLNKIRKTYASTLINGNVTDSVVTAQMGHSNITTTRMHYYKDKTNRDQKQDEINSVSELSKIIY